MMYEKQHQKFHTDDGSLSRSGTSASDWLKISSSNQKHYSDLGSDTSSVWMQSFLRCYFVGKPVVGLQLNVSCFLRL